MNLKPKPEGHPFASTCWEPKHPARWCKLKYLWRVIRSRNVYGPYGIAWTFGPYNWTCYMRFRGMPGYYSKGMLAGIREIGFRAWWNFVAWEHVHRRFHDAYVVQQMVAEGMADDPFLTKNYALMVVDVDETHQSL